MSAAYVGEIRDVARSDHEPIVADIPPSGKKPKTKHTWGPRVLKDPDQIGTALQETPEGNTYYAQVKNICLAITKPHSDSITFHESETLQLLRREAHRTPPGQARKQAWKQVQKLQKQEHKLWEKELIDQASQMNWKAMRAIDHLNQPRHWEHRLLDPPDWPDHLQQHFKKIFNKADLETTERKLETTKNTIRQQCKRTPWEPFSEDEMRVVSLKWEPRKSTGPDSISHEALQHLLADKVWTGRLREMLNDMFYIGRLHPGIAEGVTVLLPKTHAPTSWGETRPITLSSTILKWLAQLLLHRCGEALCQTPQQYASPRRQSAELVFILRRVTRMSKDWGDQMYVVKLDIQKAFDSVGQPAMADLVRRKVADAGKPWEAQLWIDVIRAREINVAIADRTTPVPQTNGVRQGSPDSPRLFAELIGECLQETLVEDVHSTTPTPPHPAQPRELPPCPTSGGAFMDDTYLWGGCSARLQRLITTLEAHLKRQGLDIHPKKTGIISSHSQGKGTPFRIGGETVLAQGPDVILHALGSPLTFDNVTTALAAEMQGRARRTFHLRKRILCAATPLGPRLKLHNTYVRSSALWACNTWPIQESLLKQANSQQLHQVRAMLGRSRQPTEQWAEWNTRTLREARMIAQREQLQRWSTFVLWQVWGLVGHLARGHPTTQAVLQWRNIKWWRGQQSLRHGARHAHRFNPHLDIERHIVAVAGEDWLAIAQNRQRWQELGSDFVRKHDPPWATGRQQAIHNLTPNRSHPTPPPFSQPPLPITGPLPEQTTNEP